MKIIILLSLFLLIIPTIEGAGIIYYQTDLELDYREVGCVDYIVQDANNLEFEGEIKEMVVSVTPEELKPGESNNVQVCFKGKKSANGEIIAKSPTIKSRGIGSATGMAASAPLKINVNRTNFFLMILFGFAGVGMIAGIFIKKRFK